MKPSWKVFEDAHGGSQKLYIEGQKEKDKKTINGMQNTT